LINLMLDLLERYRLAYLFISHDIAVVEHRKTGHDSRATGPG